LTVAGPGSTLRPSSTVSGLTANVVLNADLTIIGTNSNFSLTFAPTSVISGTGGLIVRSPANTSAGTPAVTIQSASTYAGATTLDLNAIAGSTTLAPSSLTFSGASGSALSSPTFNVRAGGVLTLNN